MSTARYFDRNLAAVAGSLLLVVLPLLLTVSRDESRICSVIPLAQQRLPEAILWQFMTQQTAALLQLLQTDEKPRISKLHSTFSEHQLLYLQFTDECHFPEEEKYDVCREVCQDNLPHRNLEPRTSVRVIGDLLLHSLRTVFRVCELSFTHLLSGWLVIWVFVIGREAVHGMEVRFTQSDDRLYPDDYGAFVQTTFRLMWAYVLVRSSLDTYHYFSALKLLAPNSGPVVQVLFSFSTSFWMECLVMMCNWWAMGFLFLLFACVLIVAYLGYESAFFFRKLVEFATTQVDFNCRELQSGPETTCYGETDCSICFEPLHVRSKQNPMRISAAGRGLRISASSRRTEFSRPLLEVNRCRHVYHRECLVKWLDSTNVHGAGVSTDGCPLCRSPLFLRTRKTLKLARSVGDIVRYVRQSVNTNFEPEEEERPRRRSLLFGLLRVLAIICYVVGSLFISSLSEQVSESKLARDNFLFVFTSVAIVLGELAVYFLHHYYPPPLLSGPFVYMLTIGVVGGHFFWFVAATIFFSFVFSFCFFYAWLTCSLWTEHEEDRLERT